MVNFIYKSGVYKHGQRKRIKEEGRDMRGYLTVITGL